MSTGLAIILASTQQVRIQSALLNDLYVVFTDEYATE